MRFAKRFIVGSAIKRDCHFRVLKSRASHNSSVPSFGLTPSAQPLRGSGTRKPLAEIEKEVDAKSIG